MAAAFSERLKSVAFSISSLNDSWQKLTKILTLEGDKANLYSSFAELVLKNAIKLDSCFLCYHWYAIH